MIDSLGDFGKIAEFLKHPLVLVGFALMLFFNIHKLLLKSGILPPVNQKQGSLIVTLLLRYGFWLGVLIVVSGFGLQFYQAYLDKINSQPEHSEQHIGPISGNHNIIQNGAKNNVTSSDGGK